MMYYCKVKSEIDFNIFLMPEVTYTGINFGRAFIGPLGRPNHKQFAVIGDPVNTASRLTVIYQRDEYKYSDI